MSTCPEPPSGTMPDSRFLERIRKSFAHDLRTPLGAIVNYAGVLEAAPEAGADEVRDVAAHIRRNAQRIATMLGLLARATELASAVPSSMPTDLLEAARSALGEAGGRGSVRLAAGNATATAALDADLLQFAWRAYLVSVCDAMGSGPPLVEIEVRITSDYDPVEIELYCSAVLPDEETLLSSGEFGEPSGFLRQNGGTARIENALGLTLASEVMLARGGNLLVSGQPTTSSALRIRFPSTARDLALTTPAP